MNAVRVESFTTDGMSQFGHEQIVMRSELLIGKFFTSSWNNFPFHIKYGGVK